MRVDDAKRHGVAPTQVRLQQTDDTVMLKVWDSGPGPAPAEYEQVFTPFYRRHDSRSIVPIITGTAYINAESVLLLDEGDPQKVDRLEQAFFNNHVTEDVLFVTGQGIAPWMASVTFGGPRLETVYIGSLKGKRIPYFRAPAPGLPPQSPW